MKNAKKEILESIIFSFYPKRATFKSEYNGFCTNELELYAFLAEKITALEHKNTDIGILQERIDKLEKHLSLLLSKTDISEEISGEFVINNRIRSEN